MAVDAFIYFVANNADQQPVGETTDDVFSKKKAFALTEFSFDIENPSTVSSSTSGAGGGKAKLNEFTIKRPTDNGSTMFFKNACTGTHYKAAVIVICKSGGDPNSTGVPYLLYEFGMVFTTKIEWSGPGDEGPEESVTFAYGRLGVKYVKQNEDGSMVSKRVVGWDQLTNTELGEDKLKFDSWAPA